MRVLAVTNLYPTPHKPTLGTFVEQQVRGLRRIGIDVEVLFVDRIRKGIWTYQSLASEIRLAVAAFRPDIIHVMYGGVMSQVITRVVVDTPVVVSFCGTDLLGGSHFSLLKRFFAQYGVFASYIAAKRADGIIVKSKNLKNALPRKINLEKVRVIPNGVDLDRFKPIDQRNCLRRLGWRADCFHVLFSSSGGDLCKRFALAQAAVKALNDLGVLAELHQLTGVEHNEVPVWLNASDVVLLTSVHEGSPNIIKEALACDLPVVSVDVGDVKERIKGIEGCYIALPDPSDLAAKLCLVHSGLRRVEGRCKMQELSVESVANRLKKLYEECLR